MQVPLSGAVRRSPPREQSCCLFRLGLLSAHRASFTVTQAIRSWSWRARLLPHDTDGAERPTSTVLRREVARSERTHARARGALHGRGPVHRGARHRQPQGHRAQPADRRTSGWTTSRSSTPTWTRSTGPTSAASSPGQLHPAGQSLSRRPVHRAGGIPRRRRWENIRDLWSPPADE